MIYVYVGMVATATRTILENLDRIPNEDARTKVAILAYDASIYFFSIPVGSFISFHVTPTSRCHFQFRRLALPSQPC